MRVPILRIVLLILTILVVYAVVRRLGDEGATPKKSSAKGLPIPVEVVAVERGAIEFRRTLSGTLEASEEVTVASRVSGGIVRLAVDIGDAVEHDDIVAELDGAEYRQALAEAEANLAVARANKAEAESALLIARRAINRVKELRERNVASEADEDIAQADVLARESALEVAKSAITRVEARVETARIRVEYTQIQPSWDEEKGTRYVAERFVDVGDTVSPNQPLLSIVDLDPLTAVVFVTERDYALLAPGQTVTLTTDAYPDTEFPSRVERIAPVFRTSSRQARVELSVTNSDRRLRPGMFVLADVLLHRADEAWIVPEEALAVQGGENGVFVVDSAGQTVRFQRAEAGIRQAGRVEIRGVAFDSASRVVTVGQELLEDEARIRIPKELVDPASESSPTSPAESESSR